MRPYTKRAQCRCTASPGKKLLGFSVNIHRHPSASKALWYTSERGAKGQRLRCRVERVTEGRNKTRSVDQAQGHCQGHWALQSLSEAEATALGVEIRTHSVKAALVDIQTGSFLRPGAAVKLDTCDPDSIASALRRLTKEFAWSGPVGCSITIAVAREFDVNNTSFTAMGNEVGKILKRYLPRNPLVTMVHTEAAGYEELSFAASSAARNDLVLVCTIGKNLGAVLYNEGHRVRNMNINKGITGGYGQDLNNLEERFKDSWTKVKNATYLVPTLPDENLEDRDAWDAWVKLVDSYLIQVAEYVKPSRIILMPTGAYTVGPLVERMVSQLKVSTQSSCKPDVVAVNSAIGALVKGAAVGALVELKAQEALATLRQAVGQDIVQLQNLNSAQLRAAFDYFDDDGDGIVTEDQLKNQLQNLGSSLSPDVISQRLSGISTSVKGQVRFEEFQTWWERTIKRGPVTLITSEVEWQNIIDNPFPDRANGKDALIILEVGFSFCRPCKKFEPKYERYAKMYDDVRFVRINGNENEDTISFCKDKLEVRKTPSFFMFKNQKQCNSWTGANEEIFRANLLKFACVEE